MLRAMRKLVVTMVVVGLTACGFPKSGPAPGPLAPNTAEAAAQRWPGTTAAQLEEGRTLFVAKCNGCHDYPDMHAIPESRWPDVVMKKMGENAKLTTEQSTQVLHFILAAQ
jgi:cytochrome c5